MPLNVRVEEGSWLNKTVVLEGRLDDQAAEAFDKELDRVLASQTTVLVFDLGKLEYVTSAGIRSLLRAQKAMKARGGSSVLLNPQPTVQKVLDIVRVADVSKVFRNVQELDAYLDAMQKKVLSGDDDDEP